MRLPQPNGRRVSGELRGEAEERVSCTRGLGRPESDPAARRAVSCMLLLGSTAISGLFKV